MCFQCAQLILIFVIAEQLKFADHKGIATHARCMNEQSAIAKDMRIDALHYKQSMNNCKFNEDANGNHVDMNKSKSLKSLCSTHDAAHPNKSNIACDINCSADRPVPVSPCIDNKKLKIDTTPAHTPIKNDRSTSYASASSFSCVNKNIANNPYFKGKDKDKRTRNLKDAFDEVANPNAQIESIQNNVCNNNSTISNQNNNAAGAVCSGCGNNATMEENMKTASVIGSINRLFNKGLEMSSSRRAVVGLSESKPKIGFKDKMLKLIEGCTFDSDKTEDRYEKLIIMNSTLISHMIDKIDELDKMINNT